MTRLPVSMIAACSLDRAIGRLGRLPWSLPADWAYFCAVTRGQVLVVGRRSFAEFDGPIPGRFTIVLAEAADLDTSRWPDVRVARSLDEALALADGEPLYRACRRVFVGGGERLFAEAMDHERVESCYVTRVQRWIPDGDAFLPKWTPHFPRLRSATSTTSASTRLSFEVWLRE